MKPLNLSWGNPDFLSPYWNKINLSLPRNIPTSYVMGSLPELQDAIKALHAQEKNAVTADRHVVIGAGATQVLSAILTVLKKPVTAHSPYFLRFPAIAKNVGVRWKFCMKGVEIITNPNNPDGKVRLTDSVLFPIYDLSYNWPQYTNPINYNQDIMIFSLAKATGHASTRIGWALIKDPQLAADVTRILDEMSSGTAIESQLKAIKIINSQLNREDTCFQYGRDILMARYNKLASIKLPFKKLSHNGMFLWIEANDPTTVFSSRDIIYTPGDLLGSSYNFARLNMGCSEKDFKEFIKRIRL